MSWKSLLTTGLLCFVASPAFANPTLYVTNHALDANGNWIWDIDIGATTGTSPVAAELGFVVDGTTAGQQLISATAGAPFTGLNTQNPGTQIFTWETLDPTANNKPVGLQTNCGAGCTSSAGGGLDQVFSAMGSFADLPQAASAPAAGVTTNRYMRIITAGPTSSALQTTLEVKGKYALGGGAGNNGRIAEITSGTNATNYNNFAGTAQRTLKAGDIDLNTFTNGDDFGIFVGQYAPAVGGKVGGWTIGDFDRNGFVNGDDFGVFVGGYAPGVPGGSSTNLAIGGQTGSSASIGLELAAVPEPASIALLGLALLGGMGLLRRRVNG